ncbi:unnamed protein product [Pocillopora meandrina]|uniref:Uncharacterized protein n=1 Tax=Pocillopora meandrina TaxID=46732 RepID=A0AAU9XBE6_9CNID|nr:unnamed protein product [Pocillopora meandrina]
MMILTRQPTQTVNLIMLVFVISGTRGYRLGLEIINGTSCGKYDKTPTFKVSPWPFIPAGIYVDGNITFTPAVDFLEASLQYEAVSDGKVVVSGWYDNICDRHPYLCSLPAGETKVLAVSGRLPSIPPVFKKTFVKSFESGLHDDILAFNLRTTLRTPELTDEELMKQVNALPSQQDERATKLANEHQ